MTLRRIATIFVLMTASAGPDPLYFHSLGETHGFALETETTLQELGFGLVGLPIRFDAGASAFLTNRIVVRTTSDEGRQLVAALPGLLRVEPAVYDAEVLVVTLDEPMRALTAANGLQGQDGVRWAHPDFKLQLEARSTAPESEPLFAQQWHLSNTGQSGGTVGADVGIKAAWAQTTGRPETVVAVVDLGFEQLHPDLDGAWLINAGEIAGNQVDDDANGYVDDVRGWNFAINGSNLIYGQSPAHGTCTAGLVGARVNGKGVTGLCPDCRVLPIVVDEYPSNAAAAFRYAKARGAAVATNSWGYAVGTPSTEIVVEAIADLAANGRGGKGTTILFAMSNVHRNDCRGPEPDISSLDTVLAVSSTDHQDTKIANAGYGPCLDLVAPSSISTTNAILTTDRPGDKGYNTQNGGTDVADLDFTNTFYGTSAATPQVAGAFALLYSAKPELTRAEAQTLVLSTTDKVRADVALYDATTGHSLEYGYGRINVGKAMTKLVNLRHVGQVAD